MCPCTSILLGQLHIAFGDSIILASKRAALNLEGLCSPKDQLPCIKQWWCWGFGALLASCRLKIIILTDSVKRNTDSKSLSYLQTQARASWEESLWHTQRGWVAHGNWAEWWQSPPLALVPKLVDSSEQGRSCSQCPEAALCFPSGSLLLLQALPSTVFFSLEGPCKASAAIQFVAITFWNRGICKLMFKGFNSLWEMPLEEILIAWLTWPPKREGTIK